MFSYDPFKGFQVRTGIYNCVLYNVWEELVIRTTALHGDPTPDSSQQDSAKKGSQHMMRHAKT